MDEDFFCQACERCCREGESLRPAFVEGFGRCPVCPECLARIRSATYEPTVYPEGKRVPFIFTGTARRLIRTCGVCRLAMRHEEADKNAGVRVTVEDLEAIGRPGREPGVYHACEACMNQLAPLREGHLRADGFLSPEVRFERKMLV